MTSRRRKLGGAVVAAIAFMSFGGALSAATTPTDNAALVADAQTHLSAAGVDLSQVASNLGATTTTVAPTTTTTAAPTTTTTTAPTGTVKPLGVPGTWVASFADEFNGTSLDRTKWNTYGSWECCDGGRSNLAPNGQMEYMTDGNNLSFANGAVTITAKREAAPNGEAWTSGQLGSKQSFLYGYLEARAQFPSLKGFQPATWTWGAPGTNASAQETDDYEFYSDNHSQLYLTSHGTGGGGCHYTMPFDPTIAMHTYGVDIEASGTTWYVDGVKVCGPVAGHPTQPWNIVEYLAVLNSTRVPASAVVDPSTMSEHTTVDYIRAWSH